LLVATSHKNQKIDCALYKLHHIQKQNPITDPEAKMLGVVVLQHLTPWDG